MDNPDRIINRLAKTIYVVLYRTAPSPRYPKGQLTLLVEPGINKVWSIKNKLIAEMHAKENNGMAATWEDAWRLLLKEYGSVERLEDELMQRAVSVQEARAKSQMTIDVGRVPERGEPNDFNDN